MIVVLLHCISFRASERLYFVVVALTGLRFEVKVIANVLSWAPVPNNEPQEKGSI